MLKICFLSLHSYPLIKDEDFEFAGGAEVEQVALAKELVERGYEVIFVTYSFRADDKFSVESKNKIQIIKTYFRGGAKRINILSKAMRIWKALKAADADVYFHEAGSYGILPIFSQIQRRKFVHRVSSDIFALVGGYSPSRLTNR